MTKPTQEQVIQWAHEAGLHIATDVHWMPIIGLEYLEKATALAYEAGRMAQPEQEIEPDRDHVEDDGCPTEKAVLQRFWREHQKQEPVACPYCHYSHTLGAVFFDQNCAGCVNRMTTPPQREWQGLTDEEVESLDCTTVNACDWNEYEVYKPSVQEFARAIEAKLKEKNT